jgi:EAL domain-containing protein (putative c-di-GMP-specific phosphodiesterase class I)/GGDEF domain-containing protein
MEILRPGHSSGSRRESATLRPAKRVLIRIALAFALPGFAGSACLALGVPASTLIGVVTLGLVLGAALSMVEVAGALGGIGARSEGTVGLDDYDYDALTALPLRERFVRELRKSTRGLSSEDACLAVCVVRVCNIDHASATLSATEVRRLLRTQARRLGVLCGGPWPLGRVREDTLAFAVPGTGAVKGVLDAASTAVEALSAAVVFEGGGFVPRVSAGVALWPEDAYDPDEVVEKALSALSSSMQAGPRRLRLYTSGSRERMRHAFELEGALREAVRAQRLTLVYQPIVEAETARVVGAEALVRWRHPVHGDVPPSVFIPLAERCGFVHGIDRFVLEEAGRRIMTLREELDAPELFASVNLSATQFRDPHLTGWIARILHGAAIEPAAVVLEVTETAALHDLDHGARVVKALRRLGVHVALDDFGTGHSWLAYLSRIEIDRIKLDQAFVRGVHSNPRHRAICDAVARLARGLSLGVVAEGVEKPEEARCLVELGMSHLQGYYFAGPLTAERFAAYARQSLERTATPPSDLPATARPPEAMA